MKMYLTQNPADHNYGWLWILKPKKTKRGMIGYEHPIDLRLDDELKSALSKEDILEVTISVSQKTDK